MNNEKLSAPVIFFKQNSNVWWLPKRALKRKFDSLLPPTGRDEPCYPSPPMSSPPSPPGPPAEYSQGAASEPGTSVASTAAPAFSFVPSLPAAAATVQFARPPLPFGPAQYASSPREQLAASATAQYPIPGVLQAGITVTSGPAAMAGPSFTAPSSTRTGRKSKAHVASACINCKRAHLSCDVQRPCARCVASGKQVSGSPS